MSDPGSKLAIITVENGWKVDGEIDSHTAPKLASSMETLPDHATTVVADFSGVSFMDSSGLRVLVEASARAAEAGSKLVILNSSAAIRRVVEISGLADTLLLAD
jgi:anti-sigma B factor antagonist